MIFFVFDNVIKAKKDIVEEVHTMNSKFMLLY